jgi:glutamate racemase
VPYGTRSAATIEKFTRQDIRFLKTFDIAALVVACGTVSTAVLPSLAGEGYAFPMIGVVRPAVQAAIQATRNGSIGLMATAASVRSGAYDKALQDAGTGAPGAPFSLTSVSCSLLVPLVENGRTDPADPALNIILQEYLEPLLSKNVDVIILGCTHYPLIADAVTALAPGVSLIDAGRETAVYCAGTLPPANPEQTGTVRFYVSDTADNFSAIAERFLGQSLSGSVERIEIEDY